MQSSIVNFNKIDLGNRIDAEYFEPEYLKAESILFSKGAKSLNQYCKITASAFYPAATQLYSTGNIPFIRCVDIINYPAISKMQDKSFEKLPSRFVYNNKNIKLIGKGDIAISKVGSPCYASVIFDLSEVALSRTVLGLKSIKGINPYYLTVFLRCKYGFKQLMRERELTIQYQLTLDRVANVLIYKPTTENFEKLISNLFFEGKQLSNKAIKLHENSEDMLLSELGLNDWQPKHQLYYVKQFSDTQAASRIDGEYYQPKYEEVLQAIKKVPHQRLGDLVSYSKGIEVGSDAYTEEGVPFIRVSNISLNGIDSVEKRISKKLYEKLFSKYAPRKGDILITKDGSLGITFVMQEDYEGILSGAFLKLRTRAVIEKEYLALVLNSTLCQRQIEQLGGGAIIAHIKPSDIMNLLVPILDLNFQQEITKKIIATYQARATSKALLDIAKIGVEMAIEQNEQIAEDWMNKQLYNLYDLKIKI